MRVWQAISGIRMSPSWQPHPETDSLRKGMLRCGRHIERFEMTIYRAVGYRYANQSDILTGTGARLHGARWNPPHAFRAVYGSLNPFAALAETGAIQSRFGIPFSQRTPLVMVAVGATLKRVLNLNDGQVRRRLGVSRERMLAAEWERSQRNGQEALTQAIGRLAFEWGLEGLLVPSVQLKKEVNLVIFPENLDSKSALRIVNREALPQRREAESD